MVWCDMATVGPDGRPRTRIVHPVWEGDTTWMTSIRVGPKAEDVERNQSCWQKPSSIPHGCGRNGASGAIVIRGGLGDYAMPTEPTPGADDGATEEPAETRTIQEPIDAGYAGHVRGSDGGAEIDVDLSRAREEAVRWKWQDCRAAGEWQRLKFQDGLTSTASPQFI
jgi:hypothetical protein